MFDDSGRPLAAAFYTGKVGYHDLIFVSKIFVKFISPRRV